MKNNIKKFIISKIYGFKTSSWKMYFETSANKFTKIAQAIYVGASFEKSFVYQSELSQLFICKF